MTCASRTRVRCTPQSSPRTSPRTGSTSCVLVISLSLSRLAPRASLPSRRSSRTAHSSHVGAAAPRQASRLRISSVLVRLIHPKFQLATVTGRAPRGRRRSPERSTPFAAPRRSSSLGSPPLLAFAACATLPDGRFRHHRPFRPCGAGGRLIALSLSRSHEPTVLPECIALTRPCAALPSRCLHTSVFSRRTAPNSLIPRPTPLHRNPADAHPWGGAAWARNTHAHTHTHARTRANDACARRAQTCIGARRTARKQAHRVAYTRIPPMGGL